MWVRGLKLPLTILVLMDKRSHPVWVRGLKQTNHQNIHVHLSVAPRVGAWIETRSSLPDVVLSIVAPRVGAWIETSSVYLVGIRSAVAPRVGAWIET